MSITSKGFSVILDSIHEGIIAINGDGLITVFNRAAERIMKLPTAKVMGQPIAQVIPNTRLHLVLKKGQPELNSQQKIHNTTIVTNRAPIRDEVGDLIGAAAVFRDISEIVILAEEITKLKETQALLKAIINSTHDAISVVDENGLGLMINPAYTRLTGLTEEAVLDKPATVDIAEGESMHLQVLRTGRPVTGVPMKVGPSKREVIVNCAPLKVQNKSKGSVGVIHDVSEIHRLSEELEHAKQLIRHLEAKYTFQDITGKSTAVRQAVELAKRASATPATVLLRGESGTGKELFAHAIHHSSQRAREKFVRVNCAAIPDSLMESELFGYVAGAFTGALRGGKQGFFQEGHGGTLFLDEVAEIGLHVQAKLLRVLQEKEVLPVGSTTPTPINVRIITATNANLEELIHAGKFREDLYYRLNVIPIRIPALRRRKEDIPYLSKRIIEKYNQEYGRNVASISRQVISRLQEHHWPGNVRELENVLGRAIINMKLSDTEITLAHLPQLEHQSPNNRAQASTVAGLDSGKDYNQLKYHWEKELFQQVLQQSGGSKTQAARLLNISVRTLYNKLKNLDLD
ncbi:sigma-54-dependent Fis family transcriptional regulator [Metallumcola ferriviriculae]|uniref:Sigma-54-dependent Fis family transcriptional regulator n=1 Tax=Metallumcola ferriviriculae TaxID=3039180 RepID=A0AAU0UK50_9FIRM|nr:sigma-54-dependent Fis family transcriptional regulator [Desulfitibacteraceae bacterium MK1]